MSEAGGTFDVVVLGAGAAGMTAAVVAAINGLRVLLLERTSQVGGTTSRSAGTLWVPGNFTMSEADAQDDVAQAARYLDAVVGDGSSRRLRARYLRHAPAMLRFLEQHTVVRFQGCPRHTDYWPDVDGARAGGRPVEACVYDGRDLGAHFATLRAPLPEFMVLGGMMVSKSDIDRLLTARRSITSARHATRLVARYAADRIRGFSRGTRLTMGNALAGRLLKSVLDAGVALRTSCVVEGVMADGDGAHRLSVDGPDGAFVVRARKGVVFAGGGYSGNVQWRRRYMPTPTPQQTAAHEGNAASSLELALALGGVLGTPREQNAWWFPCSRVARDDGTVGLFPHIVLDRAKPGVIAVDRHGRRFVNEGVNYHQFCLAQYASDAVPCWLVCDDAALRRYGLGAVHPGGRSTAAWTRRGYLRSAPTLAALAERLGMPRGALEDSAQRMSGYAATGKDLQFGKGDDAVSRQNGDAARRPNPCLGPVEVPPFHAVEVAPADLGTSLGLVVQDDARLVDAQGNAIAGLYACGNDMDSIMSDRYPAPGTTLGPGMTFGYLAALHLAGIPAT